MNTRVIILGLIGIALVIVTSYIIANQKATVMRPITDFQQCADAGYPIMESYPRQCRVPDGQTFVEIIDQNDEPTSDRIAAGYVSGHISIGPNCPVEKEGEPCLPPPGAYSSREVIIYESDMTTVKERLVIDEDGNYKIAIGPGVYYLQVHPAGIGEGEKKRAEIISFETTVVDFDIDTGIR